MTPDEKEAIDKFPVVAQNFCQFVERSSDLDRREFLQQVAVLLAQLCEVGIRLPRVSSATAEDVTVDRLPIRTEEFAIEKRLREKLGTLNNYWEVFDPTQKEDPVNAFLSMDIAEVYADLREAVKLSESTAAREDVYFDWQFSFQSHWSRHAASALKVALLISDAA